MEPKCGFCGAAFACTDPGTAVNTYQCGTVWPPGASVGVRSYTCRINQLKAENAELRADVLQLAGLIGCLYPSEEGVPSCDPLCISCRSRLAWYEEAASPGSKS